MTKTLQCKDDLDLTSGSIKVDVDVLKRQEEWLRQNEASQRKKRKRLNRQAERRKEDENRELLRREEQRQRREDERKYGPLACDLIRKAYEEGVENDYSCRYNVVGNYNQGKSSLVAALVGSCGKSIYSTNGIDIARYKCRRDASGKIIYDQTHGQDPVDMAKRINATQSARKNPIQKIKYLFTSTYKRLWGTNNQVHLPKDMTEEERNVLIQTVKHGKKEIIGKDDIIQIMDVWDFAGQMVFYATHTLFHSRKAVYLLVLNLSLKLSDVVLNEDEECRISHGKRTMEYYVRFWVNSVHSFVGNEDGSEPIIILVGTHLDKLEGDDSDKKRQADKYFDDIRSLFKGKQALNHIYRKDFALDTKDPLSKSLSDLRDTLINLGNEMSLSRTIPAKWIQLEKCLFERRDEKIVKFSTIVEIDAATEYPLKDKEHIKLFLKHKHDQGALVYFDEEPISEFVVLDPQFLVDAFKGLITAKRFVTNTVFEAWEALSTEGKLENSLIDKLWTSARRKGFMKHKDTILWFLQKHRIISQALKFDETNQKTVGLGWYVVPSLLPDHVQTEEILMFQKGRVQTKIQYVISFDNSAIVPTVYNRLIAAVLGKWSILEFRGTKLLFENLSIVQIDCHHAGVIKLNDKHIHLSVMTLGQRRGINTCISDGFRRFAESVIMYEFRKHHGVTEHKILPFTRGYSCNHKSHNPNGGSKIKQLDRDLNIGSSTCPDLESHEIQTTCATAEWFQGNESLTNVPSGCPSHETLAMISQHIGKNWEILASKLGILKVKIDHIKAEQDSSAKQIFYMLLEWKKIKEENISLNDLVRELQRLPKVRVNWDGIRNIVDELNNMRGSSAM